MSLCAPCSLPEPEARVRGAEHFGFLRISLRFGVGVDVDAVEARPDTQVGGVVALSVVRLLSLRCGLLGGDGMCASWGTMGSRYSYATGYVRGCNHALFRYSSFDVLESVVPGDAFDRCG